MRNFLMALSAASLVLPAAMVLPTSKAEARHHYRHSTRYYRARNCTRSSGTTGLVAGGIGGALLGRTIDTGGDRTIGTLGGAAAGALAGRAIDRTATASRRCRY